MDQGPPSSKTDEPCVNSTENAESDSEKCTSEKSPTAIGDEEKVNWAELLLLCIPIALISFLVWLDETILATAIPKISDEFDSFSQIGWYGPAYLFGLCTCQLPFGQVYKDFPPRLTYLVSLLIFEAASILQAAAPSSSAFIIGRVFAGIGGSGVLAGSLTLFSEDIPKSRLPYIMGSFSWVHILGSIAGPIIGGAITTSSLTWRW
jgi:MFS family permease